MAWIKVRDPLIELLAIKLYEHDHTRYPMYPMNEPSWTHLAEEDRESYRRMARGEPQ